MEKYTVLYNPHSGGGNGFKVALGISRHIKNAAYDYQDMTAIKNLDTFISSLPLDTKLIVCGGDGTLNSFINRIDCDNIKHSVYFYASGSGNDFARDIHLKRHSKPACINKYIENLPFVTVNGKSYKFINGVGSGLDGYCCYAVDRLRKNSKKRASYVLMAIKALLYAYRPGISEVCVDGAKYKFKDAWLVPTMNGRYFGGGFMAAPKQDRLAADNSLSLVAMHSKNILLIITAFILIFFGKHIWLKKVTTVIKGNSISVKLDRPAPLQIDGEVIPDISEYYVSSAKQTVKA